MKKRPFIFQKAIGSFNLIGTFFFDDFSRRELVEGDILLLMIRVKFSSGKRKLKQKRCLLVQSTPFFEVIHDDLDDTGEVKLDHKRLNTYGEQKILYSVKVKQKFIQNPWQALRCIPDKLVHLNLSTPKRENILT